MLFSFRRPAWGLGHPPSERPAGTSVAGFGSGGNKKRDHPRGDVSRDQGCAGGDQQASGSVRRTDSRTASTSRGGSGSRPTPSVRNACQPDSASMITKPSARSCSRFRRVAHLGVVRRSRNDGEVPKRLNGADCKSVGYCLRRFESSPLHHGGRALSNHERRTRTRWSRTQRNHTSEDQNKHAGQKRTGAR